MQHALTPATATAGDPAALERPLKSQAAAAAQPQELAKLEQQAREIETARKQMATDPQLAQQMLNAQMTKMQANAAAEQLQALADNLAERDRQLKSLAGQADQLAQRSKTADGTKLDGISQQQRRPRPASGGGRR